MTAPRHPLTWLGLLLAATLFATAPAVAAPPLPAQAPEPAAVAPGAVQVTAMIGPVDTAESSASRPVRLNPPNPAHVAVVVTNGTAEPVTVTRVEVAGTVLGLAFFGYQSTVLLTVEPGGVGALRYPLDLSGLDRQVTGLVHGSVEISGPDGTLATLPMVVDVDGSLLSVYGLFGLALVVLTVVAVLDAAIATARRRAPANRWRRGARWLAPGAGLGLVVVFAASATSVWLAGPTQWLLAAAASAAVFLAVGCLPAASGEGGDGDTCSAHAAGTEEAGDDFDDTAGIYTSTGPNPFDRYDPDHPAPRGA